MASEARQMGAQVAGWGNWSKIGHDESRIESTAEDGT